MRHLIFDCAWIAGAPRIVPVPTAAVPAAAFERNFRRVLMRGSCVNGTCGTAYGRTNGKPVARRGRGSRQLP